MNVLHNFKWPLHGTSYHNSLGICRQLKIHHLHVHGTFNFSTQCICMGTGSLFVYRLSLFSWKGAPSMEENGICSSVNWTVHLLFVSPLLSVLDQQQKQTIPFQGGKIWMTLRGRFIQQLYSSMQNGKITLFLNTPPPPPIDVIEQSIYILSLHCLVCWTSSRSRLFHSKEGRSWVTLRGRCLWPPPRRSTH